MSERVFAQRSIGDITVLVPSRNGGTSTAPFESLNLAAYVGDDARSVQVNLDLIRDDIGAQSISITQAEHGTTALVVTSDAPNPPCDVLITTTPGVALLALAADCVPIALVDPINRVVGVIHAGWKGVKDNVVESAVRAFINSGANLKSTTAVIGPSICGICYEVSADRVDVMRAHCPDAVADDRHLDLARGVTAQLTHHGIASELIPGCTNEDDRLFSYRRTNKEQPGLQTGRGGILVALPSA